MAEWVFIKEKNNDGPVVERQGILPFQPKGYGNMIGLCGRRLK